ncbi:MAG: ACT domain-containing protein, partial [Verrucomicrobiia bacterium]
MQRYATITVIGRDKTGVIARVTNFLFQQKANIEALEEAVTRGQFSMAIQASWLDGQLKPATLKRGLNALGKELGMEMRLRLTEPGRKQRMALMVTRESACPEAMLAAFRKGQL